MCGFKPYSGQGWYMLRWAIAQCAGRASCSWCLHELCLEKGLLPPLPWGAPCQGCLVVLSTCMGSRRDQRQKKNPMDINQEPHLDQKDPGCRWPDTGRSLRESSDAPHPLPASPPAQAQGPRGRLLRDRLIPTSLRHLRPTGTTQTLPKRCGQTRMESWV